MVQQTWRHSHHRRGHWRHTISRQERK